MFNFIILRFHETIYNYTLFNAFVEKIKVGPNKSAGL